MASLHALHSSIPLTAPNEYRPSTRAHITEQGMQQQQPSPQSRHGRLDLTWCPPLPLEETDEEVVDTEIEVPVVVAAPLEAEVTG